METQRAASPHCGVLGVGWGGHTKIKNPKGDAAPQLWAPGCWSQSSQRHRPGTAGDHGEPRRDAVSPCRAAERCPPPRHAPLRGPAPVPSPRAAAASPTGEAALPVPCPQKNETDAPQAAQVGSWGFGTTGDPTPHPFTPSMERNRSPCPCWVTALMSPGSKPLKTVPTPVPLRWPVLLAFPSRFLSLRQQLLVASHSAFCFLPLFSQGKTLRSRPRSGSSQGDTEPTAPVPAPKPRCRALGSGNPALDAWEWGRGLRVGAKPPELP